MGYGHRLEGDRRVRLEDFEPVEDAGRRRRKAERNTAQRSGELIELPELLQAGRRQRVLVIRQGRDTGGKDGTIRHVAGPLDWQSRAAASFKNPTEEEFAHDFLWRAPPRFTRKRRANLQARQIP